MSDDPKLDALVAQLLEHCRERGHAVSLAGTVSTEIAAELVERSPGTLQNWRSGEGGGPLVFVRHGGRRAYRLVDIAEFLLGDEP